MKKGQKLYKQAKKVILGGNMLFSKRPELFLPDQWPTYFSKAKGTHVWDLENKKYLDMICTPGPNILGYSNNEIDNEVIKYVKKGNMTTFNCPEEVSLAKKITKIHPWSKMVKFTRSGGEANAISIRIARAASKKDKIAVCGYHGWHDWYLSINLSGKNNLKEHLLPGLNPDGVPKNLKQTVFPFNYNDIESLQKILKKHDIGTIKMEVARYSKPNIEFLKEVRKIANKKKIVLIFDECTTGFRRNMGGLHLSTGVEPDMAMFGKAIGNGYAINAIIGKKKVMEAAEESFISSTFWTERIGYVAGNTTIELMENLKPWKNLIKMGKIYKDGCLKLAKKYDINLDVTGIDTINYLNFEKNKNQIYKTFITQEMLKSKILSSNLIYLNICHKKNHIDSFLKKLDEIFKKIKKIEIKGNLKSHLKGPVSHNTFKRLN
jgi:glutamate-1-semialdehyde aminotransferase